MLNVAPRSDFSGSRQTSRAAQFAGLLHGFYHALVDEGVPEHLAALVRRIDQAASEPVQGERRLALVVDSDAEARALAAALLDESGLRVVECPNADAALAALEQRTGEVAFVFMDAALPGPLSGIALAERVRSLQPAAHVVVTADEDQLDRPLPEGVIRLCKPWRGLELLMEAGRAVADHAPEDRPS